MTDFLIQQFINKNQSKDKERQQYGRLSSIVGIVVNVLLAASKILIGLLVGSIAILGDGINNLFDSGSSVISLVTFHIVSKPADADHPFGHARFEYISSSVVAMLIVYVAITLFTESVDKIMNPTEMETNLVTVLVLVISIGLKFWLYSFYKNVGKRINSGLLFANAADSISDVMATSGILLALVISPLIGINLDGPMGIVIAVIIFKSGIDILMGTYNHLMGRPPVKEEVDYLEGRFLSFDGILGLHDMIIHDYGPGKKFVTVHLEVDASMSMMDAHQLVDHVERTIESEDGYELTIHIDPIKVDDPETDRVRYRVDQIVKDINEDYSIHDFRLIPIGDRTLVNFDVLIPAEDKIDDKELMNEIESMVNRINDKVDLVIEIDRDYIERGEE